MQASKIDSDIHIAQVDLLSTGACPYKLALRLTMVISLKKTLVTKLESIKESGKGWVEPGMIHAESQKS